MAKERVGREQGARALEILEAVWAVLKAEIAPAGKKGKGAKGKGGKKKK